ncbi:MAG: amidohydrolase family protein [Desulfurococcales archaeon]|nr:amidohydrolase family protein [Desulfurococcales archaeon]
MREPGTCVIDAHTHSPQGPQGVRSLVRSLRSSGAHAAVILGIPPLKPPSIPMEEVVREHSRAEGLIRKYAPGIAEALRPESLMASTILLTRSLRPLCQALDTGGGDYTILAGVNLGMDPEDLAKWLHGVLDRGAGGFKVISTLQLKYLDDPSMHVVLEVAEERGVPVVVHAGCDPGIWELPAFCRYGDPSRLESLLREYRDVVVIIAHAGGYSAIAPGVFTEEALHLARRFEGVRVDTSALPPELAAYIASSLPEGKVLYGTDYPVVEGLDPRVYLGMVYTILRVRGVSRSRLEAYLHGAAEEVFGLRCLG